MFSSKTSKLIGIIGLGRFGFALAQSLSESGKGVIVIDCNESKIQLAKEFTDNAFLVETLTKEALEETGIKTCDVVIVCIGEKIDTSILTTLNVLNMGVKRVISKAISFEQGDVLQKLGAEVVYPERDMAIRLANRLATPNILDYIELNNDVCITELKLTEKMNGISLDDIDLRNKYGLNVIAVKRDGLITTEIGASYILNQSDELILVGNRNNAEKFEKFMLK